MAGRDNGELYEKSITSIDQARLVLTSSDPKEAGTWSPDGRYLAFTQNSQKTHRDIWIVPLFGDRKPVPFLQTEANEHTPVFSPDGHWIAYISDKGGDGGLCVREFPTGSREWTIAADNSVWPSWRADGKELLYVSRGAVMSVAVRLGESPEFAGPTKLFTAPISPGRFGQYAVSSDGQRFLMIEQQDAATSAAAVPLTVVLNWTAGLGN